MYFRPLLRFTALCIPSFLILVALGIWQLERLQWKLGLIAEMNGHLHATPIPPAELLKLAPGDAQYRPAALDGHFDNAREAYVYAAGDNGVPVYHVIVPFILDGGGVLLVDRGVIPLQLQDPATRSQGILDGERHIVGVWRTPGAPGLFTPPPDLAHRVWYSRDVAGIARTYRLKLLAPVILEADATPLPGGWPKGGQTVVTLRNDHLQYAITWFLLAASLVVIYFAYHQAQGRFGIRR